MLSLVEDLQEQKKSLREFEKLTLRILEYLPIVLSGYKEKHGYRIHFSEIAGTIKYLKPINQRLFVYSPVEFKTKFCDFEKLFDQLKSRNDNWSDLKKELIDSIIYTIQQSIGAGFDLLINPNSARKHVGNRFEELIKSVFNEMGIANKRIVLQIPYKTDEGEKNYKCENDLIISPYQKVKSTGKQIDIGEIVVSVKTTSKDRMGKMFIDKLLLEKFVNHNQKVIGVFLNDVQRKENSNISFTLVSGLFMVYTKFLTELEGVYYVDPPPNVFKEPFNKHMSPFSDLITRDIWRLLSS